jgi:hypothetical protein
MALDLARRGQLPLDAADAPSAARSPGDAIASLQRFRHGKSSEEKSLPNSLDARRLQSGSFSEPRRRPCRQPPDRRLGGFQNSRTFAFQKSESVLQVFLFAGLARASGADLTSGRTKRPAGEFETEENFFYLNRL